MDKMAMNALQFLVGL